MAAGRSPPVTKTRSQQQLTRTSAVVVSNVISAGKQHQEARRDDDAMRALHNTLLDDTSGIPSLTREGGSAKKTTVLDVHGGVLEESDNAYPDTVGTNRCDQLSQLRLRKFQQSSKNKRTPLVEQL